MFLIVYKTFFKLVEFAVWALSLPIKGRASPGRKVCLVFPAADYGSMGDAAMMYPILARFEQVGDCEVNIYNKSRVGSWSRQANRAGGELPVDFSLSTIGECIAFLRLLKAARYVVFQGADVMDGGYGAKKPMMFMLIANLAARFGADARVLGFSVNRRPAGIIKAIFRSFDPRVKLMVRDPCSHERLCSVTCGQDVRLVSDVAFACPSFSPVDVEIEADRILVGLNVNRMLHSKYLKDAVTIEQYLDGIAESMLKLAETARVGIVHLPHDDRVIDGYSDYSSSAYIHERLIAANVPSFLIPADRLDPIYVKGVAKRCDLVITGRMHVAIGSFSNGVPCVGVDYQGKWRGLMQMVGLGDEFLLNPSDIVKSEGVYRLMRSCVAKLGDIKSIVRKNCLDLLTASEKNFEGIV